MKYNKSGSRNATFILAAMFLCSQCASVRRSATDINTGKIVFFDDFSGPALDRSKWNIVTTGQVANNEQQAYTDSAATIYTVQGYDAEGAKNGALVIQPRFSEGFTTKEGKKFDFISGRIDTRSKVEFTYGTVSARIKLTEGVGLWPAWWILGPGRWPETGEIDIMEFIGQKEWTNAAVHGPGYSGNTPFVKRDSFAVKSPVTNWHVYAADWRKDYITFKVDGKEFYRVTRDMVAQYGKWSYDNAKFVILNFALGGGYPGAVNKVKEPYYGLPAPSVDLIRKGKCKMMVDWVRITQQ